MRVLLPGIPFVALANLQGALLVRRRWRHSRVGSLTTGLRRPTRCAGCTRCRDGWRASRSRTGRPVSHGRSLLHLRARLPARSVALHQDSNVLRVPGVRRVVAVIPPRRTSLAPDPCVRDVIDRRRSAEDHDHNVATGAGMGGDGGRPYRHRTRGACGPGRRDDGARTDGLVRCVPGRWLRRTCRRGLLRPGDRGTDTQAAELGDLEIGFNRMASGLRERERMREIFGHHVGTEVARRALERESVGGERREASALFVDIIGSTGFTERRDPGRCRHHPQCILRSCRALRRR
jgi:hypothetical protein